MKSVITAHRMKEIRTLLEASRGAIDMQKGI